MKGRKLRTEHSKGAKIPMGTSRSIEADKSERGTEMSDVFYLEEFQVLIALKSGKNLINPNISD